MSTNLSISQTLGIEDALNAFQAGMVVFDRYTLQKSFGRSSVTTVWSATDAESEDQFSIKFIPKVALCDASGERQLKRSFETVRRLSHPRIVRLIDLKEDENWIAIIEENGGEQSMAALLKNQPNKFFEAADLKKALTHSIEALSYAHHAGVLHNKFTPENMLISASGDVKIADFGIARVIADCVQRATRHVGASGELPYLSPQQMDGETATPQDDIYSLGATFFELLTGTPPFHNGDVIWKIRNEEVPSVADRRAERNVPSGSIPKGWDKLIASCLAKHSDERPKSVESIVPKRDLFEGAVTVLPLARPASRTTTTAPSALQSAPETAPLDNKTFAPKSLEPDSEAPVVRRLSESSPKTTSIPIPSEQATQAALRSDLEPIVSRRPGPQPLPPLKTEAESKKLRLEEELDYEAPQKKNAWIPISLSAAAIIVAGVLINHFGLLDPIKNSIAGKSSSASTAVVAGSRSEPDVVQASARESDSLAQAREVLEAVRAERNAARAQEQASSTPVAPPAEIVAEAELPLIEEPVADTPQPVSGSDVAALVEPTPAISVTPGVEIAEAIPEPVRAAPTSVEEPMLIARNTTITPMPENLSDLSPEEKAAYEAIQAADQARATAEAALAAATKRREAEAKLAEHQQLVEAAERAAKEKEAAAAAATAALEEVKSARQAQVKEARSIMEEAQSAGRLANEQESRIAATQTQIEELRTKLEALTEQNSTLVAEIEAARQISKTKAESVEQVRSQMSKLDEDVARAEQAVDQAAREAEEARALAQKQAQELEAAKNDLASGPADAPSMTPSSSTKAVPRSNTDAPAEQPPVAASIAEAAANWDAADEVPGPTKVVATIPQIQARILPGTSPPQGFVFTNSLQMNFVPVGEVLFSTVETRRSDFENFVKATDYQAKHDWRAPGFDQTGDHPVVNVTWNDAMAFCNWLTEADRAKGVIGGDQYYRLPTDLEWSRAVGLGEEKGTTPEARDMGVTGAYPWGSDWPPTGNAGNFTGNESDSQVAIPDYDDGFVHTAPVAGFRPNTYGLHDIGGNVWEWCFDWMNRDQRDRVLRGGSWQSGGLRLSLLSSVRICSNPDETANHYGFRVVLVPGSAM